LLNLSEFLKIFQFSSEDEKKPVSCLEKIGGSKSLLLMEKAFV